MQYGEKVLFSKFQHLNIEKLQHSSKIWKTPSSSSDFARMFFNDESILYAEGTVLLYVGTSLEMLAENVSSRLREISESCNCNKLSLHPAKSEFMIFTNSIVVNRPQFFIGTDPI